MDTAAPGGPHCAPAVIAGLFFFFHFEGQRQTVVLGPCMALAVKNLPADAGDVRHKGSTPGSGRSPGGGHGNPFQCSCLENPMGRGAWRATVHGVTET